MSRVRPTAAICLLLVAFLNCTASAADATAGWEALTRLDANQALQDFTADLNRQPQDRAIRLGVALAELNRQPRLPGNVAAARELLLALRTENAQDDPGIAATYTLARLDQLDETNPDPVRAALAYRSLLAAHPGNPIAELAAPKLAILLLYDEVPLAVWEERVADVQAMLPTLRTRAAQRDTRLVLADALLRLRQDHARAYPLICYCLDANLVARPPRLGMLLLQAAESARVLGRPADAIRYYRRYVAEFPREDRTPEVRRRLAVLVGKAVP
ncbi:MAG: hypothetical protein ACHQ4G_00950 [Opitutales bacterium]